MRIRFAAGLLRLSTMLVVLLLLTSIIAAAETNICRVAAKPSGFDHQQLTLEGIAAGLRKGTSRSGRKDVTFLLTSPAGCGGVIVYAQEPASLSNGGHLRVEGTFEMEHRRDGSTFHNEMQATKITYSELGGWLGTPSPWRGDAKLLRRSGENRSAHQECPRLLVAEARRPCSVTTVYRRRFWRWSTYHRDYGP